MVRYTRAKRRAGATSRARAALPASREEGRAEKSAIFGVVGCFMTHRGLYAAIGFFIGSGGATAVQPVRADAATANACSAVYGDVG
jgi:hypothetical protein